MVASLVERVGTGEQLLQEANRRLAEQEANAKLLADQVAALQQEVSPAAAESPAGEALPVVMRTDAAETPAAATPPPDEQPDATMVPQEDEVPAQPAAATVPQEDEVPAQPAAATIQQEDEAPAPNVESPVVVTTMQVDEAQANGAVMAESASIASTAHE
ncbi:hypothetical protein P692DRAFT_20874090 [Suillus brevipes Sb2]|nr:hypothetical protein P692DRAFT_20874090 [Suillus brevipes Sb2]